MALIVRSALLVSFMATTVRVAMAPMAMTIRSGTTVQAISTATLSWKLAALWPTDLRCLRIE